jgi:O-antigen/teichoic acid export membrane protein
MTRSQRRYELRNDLPAAGEISVPRHSRPRAVARPIAFAPPSKATPRVPGGSLLPLRRAIGPHAIALADQAVVSCTSFLALILVSRWSNPDQLGVYSIGVSLLVVLIGVQGSLILLPYTIRRHNSSNASAEIAGGTFVQSGLLAAATSLLLAVAASVIAACGVGSQLSGMFWALAAAMPFVLLREFARQFSFAHLRVAEAFILDASVAAIQLVTLGWLGWSGRMSSTTACLALGGACALGGAAWLYYTRAQIAVRLDHTAALVKESWNLARWLFAAHVMASTQRQVAYWLLGAIVGAAATGVFAACMSVVSFANPLMLGLGNLLIPKAVLAYKEGGAESLLRETVRDALKLGAVIGLFCIVILFAGADIMRLLYHSQAYQGQYATIVLLTLALLPYAIGFPACNGLATMERPQAIVWAGLIGVVITANLIFLLAVGWGLVGAALAVLAGSSAEAAARWIAFVRAAKSGARRRQ